MYPAITLQRKSNPAGNVGPNDPFFHLVNRIFNDFTVPNTAQARPETTRSFTPPVDILEKDNAFFATVDLPGLKKEDIEISLVDGVLTISGERKIEQEAATEGQGFRRIERTYGTFSRSFSLPQGVDFANVEASFADGVLKLTLPKSEAAKPRKIAIA